MKYKTMYGWHEARMWLQTILSGVAVGGAILAAHPEMREKIKAVPGKLKAKFHKKKEPATIKIVVVDTTKD